MADAGQRQLALEALTRLWDIGRHPEVLTRGECDAS
jgi:hypothetical protein